MTPPRPGASTTSVILSFLLVAAAFAFGLWTLRTPAPAPADADREAFSAYRALEIVEAIARRPHPLGSEENERVRSELVRRLRALGLETRIQRSLVVYDHPRGEETRVQVAWPVNVLARLEGRTDAPAVALMSHYDSVPSGPGAGDAASGVATQLETVRALIASDESLARDLILILTDGEEIGLMGAQSFLREDPWAEDVGLVLNFEARGAAGPPFMFQTSPGNARLVAEFAAVAPRPVASSMSMEVYERMPNDTDATIVRAAAIPFLNFAFVDDFFRYHAGSDTPGNLSLRSLQHEGDNALALARHFGNLDAIPAAESDATYFNLSPYWLVRYSLGAARVLGVLALVAGLWALWQGYRHERFRLRSLAGGLLFATAGWTGSFFGIQTISDLLGDPDRPFSLFYAYHLLVVAYGLLTLGFLGGLWGEREPTRRWTAAAGALLALVGLAFAPGVGLAALSAVILLGICAARPGWHSPDAATAVHGIGWGALLVASVVFAPHASFLFAWPLLAGGIALGLVWRRSDRSPIAAAIALAPALVLWASVLYTVYLALGVPTPGAVAAALALVLGLGTLWLHRAVSPRVAAGIALLALGILGFARLRDPYTPANPRPSEVFYAVDATEREAFWVSRDSVPAPWSRPLLGEGPVEIPAGRFLPFAEDSWRGAPAPWHELPGVEIEVLGRDSDPEGWRLSLRVRSTPFTERIRLALPAGEYSRGSLEGRAVPLPEEDSPWQWDLWGLPETGARLELAGTGEPPEEIRWTRIDYDTGDPIREMIPRRPDEVMPRVWGYSEAALVAGTTPLGS